MLIQKVWEIPSSKVDPPYERGLKVVFTPTEESPIDFTLLISTLYPRGGKTALHEHENEGELMYITTGYGEAILGDKRFPIEPDIVFYAPPKVQHMVLNTSDETMKIICFFTPALPKEYIEKMQKQAKENK
ncbi:MAG: cupin domain-containing protein [Tepidanaerobacteraceae bacterium]